jgi:hypothetical protein
MGKHTPGEDVTGFCGVTHIWMTSHASEFASVQAQYPHSIIPWLVLKLLVVLKDIDAAHPLRVSLIRIP